MAYQVYIRDTGEGPERKVINEGFCWPGLFFTFFWAFTNRLWGFGTVILLVVFSLLSFGIMASENLNNEGLGMVLFSLPTVVAVVTGLMGNDWRRRHAEKLGFTILPSPDESSSTGELSARPMREFRLGFMFFAVPLCSVAILFLAVLPSVLWYGDMDFARVVAINIPMTGIPGVLLFIAGLKPKPGSGV